MIVLAVDPGSELSAYVLLCDGDILDFDKIPNQFLLAKICSEDWRGSIVPDRLAIETITSRGIMPSEAVRTAVWVGRFSQAFSGLNNTFTEITRGKILGHFCGQYGNDKAIRDAMIARYGGESKALDNGGKCPECKGRKGKRENCAACGYSGREHGTGPLFGFEGDMWSALAVGCYWEDCCKNNAALTEVH